MTIWNKFVNLLKPEPPVSLFISPPWFASQSSSGQYVNPNTAMKVPALMAGINLLVNDISSLPLRLMVRTKNGVQMAVSHPLFRRLHDNWSEDMTAREGLELSMRTLLTTGNFYNLLNFDSKGQIATIEPLFAMNVKPRRMTAIEREKAPNETSTLVFDYHDPRTGAAVTYLNSQIWRAQVGSQYGLIGDSPLHHGADAIGTSLAADRASSALFRQGSITDGYFSAEQGMDLNKTEWESLVNAWGKGSAGAYSKLVLPPGVKFNTMDLVNAQQTQFIERLKREDINMCRILNIPASILDANEKGDTYAASESQRRWYVDHTLRPWLTLLQQSINLRCLDSNERDVFYAEFDTDALLDADLQSRYDGYAKAITNGWMSRNEARKKEGLNPLPGLDVMLVPANNVGTVNPDGSIKVAGNPAPAPDKAKPAARLDNIVKATAERIVRKETKSGKFDAEFVAEVLCLTPDEAKAYCDKRSSGEITAETAVQTLLEMTCRTE